MTKLELPGRSSKVKALAVAVLLAGCGDEAIPPIIADCFIGAEGSAPHMIDLRAVYLLDWEPSGWSADAVEFLVKDYMARIDVPLTDRKRLEDEWRRCRRMGGAS